MNGMKSWKRSSVWPASVDTRPRRSLACSAIPCSRGAPQRGVCSSIHVLSPSARLFHSGAEVRLNRSRETATGSRRAGAHVTGAGADLVAQRLGVGVGVGPAPVLGALHAQLGQLLGDPHLALALHRDLEGALVVGVASVGTQPGSRAITEGRNVRAVV